MVSSVRLTVGVSSGGGLLNAGLSGGVSRAVGASPRAGAAPSRKVGASRETGLGAALSKQTHEAIDFTSC